MKHLLSVAALISIISGVPFAAVIETFEDGDYTNNPTWTVVHNAGEAVIAPDPILPNNNVLKIHGSTTAHHQLETSLTTPVTWNGFNFSMDFLSSDDNYHPQWVLFGQSSTLIGRLYRETDYPFVLVTIRDASGVQYDHTELYNQPSPINDWWRMHMWHNPDTGLINFDIRVISTNELVHASSFAPSAYLFSSPNITTLGIYSEKTSWQYIDNVILTPEPATLSLLVMGGLLLRKRK